MIRNGVPEGAERCDPGVGWTLVTVTYNSANVLDQAWRGVDLGAAQWIVVDNNSSDDSVAVARSMGAHVISRRDNPGFSISNNVGLSHSMTEWTAFVNPDVTIDIDSLSRLSALSRANGAFVAPQLTFESGVQQANARGLPTPAQKFANRGIRLPRVNPVDYARVGLQRPTYVAWVMGAALCGPTDDFRRIGGWNESYFIYYEDHEMGLRAWQHGIPTVIDPATQWVHSWQRETTSLNSAAWKAEIRSARTFYREYPDLLSRRRADSSSRFSQLRSQLWTEAVDV